MSREPAPNARDRFERREIGHPAPCEPGVSSAGGTRPGPAAPVAIRLAWDTVLVATLSVHFFLVHSFTRGLLGDVGLSPLVAAKCMTVMIVFAGFVLWIAPICELPRILWEHVLPERRIARGDCPACGHRRDPASIRCPECGIPPVPPSRWELSARPFLRFAALAITGMAIGGGVAEGRLSADERAFLAAVRRAPDLPQSRPRVAPADFARLYFEPGTGIRSDSVVESPQVAGWQPGPAGR